MGFLVGLLNGFVTSLEHRNIRRAEHVDAVLLSTLRFFAGTIVLGCVGFALSVISFPSNETAYYIAITLCLETIVAFLNVRAFQLSEQSLVGPLFGLTLVLLMPLGAFFLDEALTVAGILGVLLILVGSLGLGWSHISDGAGSVFERLRRERGVGYMLATACVAAFTITLSEAAFETGAHPLNFGFWIITGLLVTHLPFAVLKLKHGKRVSVYGVFAAGLYGCGASLHYIGLNLIYAAYYIALKRSSMLFDVCIGKLLGNEKDFRRKVFSVSIIFTGVIVISLA